MMFANLHRYLTPGRLLLALACLLVTMPVAAATGPGIFTVNVGTDGDDANPGDGACADIGGKCSLRAAIEEGNALSGATRLSPHTITFSVPEVDIGNGFVMDDYIMEREVNGGSGDAQEAREAAVAKTQA